MATSRLVFIQKTMETKEIEEIVEDKNWDIKAVKAYLDLGIDDNLDNFEESYCGKWENDLEFVQDLVDSAGDLPVDLPAYIHIDWNATARDLMMDYSEQDGYYFRNL